MTRLNTADSHQSILKQISPNRNKNVLLFITMYAYCLVMSHLRFVSTGAKCALGQSETLFVGSSSSLHRSWVSMRWLSFALKGRDRFLKSFALNVSFNLFEIIYISQKFLVPCEYWHFPVNIGISR